MSGIHEKGNKVLMTFSWELHGYVSILSFCLEHMLTERQRSGLSDLQFLRSCPSDMELDYTIASFRPGMQHEQFR
jgi:hypothetical protein